VGQDADETVITHELEDVFNGRLVCLTLEAYSKPSSRSRDPSHPLPAWHRSGGQVDDVTQRREERRKASGSMPLRSTSRPKRREIMPAFRRGVPISRLGKAQCWGRPWEVWCGRRTHRREGWEGQNA